jgi:hypothetical protein
MITTVQDTLDLELQMDDAAHALSLAESQYLAAIHDHDVDAMVQAMRDIKRAWRDWREARDAGY